LGEFPGWGDDQRQRRATPAKTLFASQKCGTNRQAKGDSLARTSLGRDQKVGIGAFFGENSGLNGGGLAIALRRQCGFKDGG
jgi:hypothetical protein